jgi:hypothetical protein
MPQSPVRELRLALTVADYDEAVGFYRGAGRRTGHPGAAVGDPGRTGRPGRGRVIQRNHSE